MAISVAPMLKRQSPSHSYGNGWITGNEGQRWHPCHSQADLLSGLSIKMQSESWLLNAILWLLH